MKKVLLSALILTGLSVAFGSKVVASNPKMFDWGFSAPTVVDPDTSVTVKKKGDIAFDLATNFFKGFDGTNWVNLGSGASGGNSMRAKIGTQMTGIPDFTMVKVAYDSVDWNYGTSAYDNTTYTFTAPTSGKYSVNAMITFTDNATYPQLEGRLYLYKNGSVYALLDRKLQTAGGAPLNINGSTTVDLNANDTLEIYFLQSTGAGSNTTVNDPQQSHLSISRLQ